MSARPHHSIHHKTWEDKVLDADLLWAQVKSLLAHQSLELPKTPRRPDVRLIVKNISGHDISFQNPGNHANGKPEHIPATGDSTAAMLMIKGSTLDEQHKNAETLFKKYDLGARGLSTEFIEDLMQGKLASLVDEAYGPAPFETQTAKLVDVSWADADGKTSAISPCKGLNAAFGARAATEENVFMAQFHIYVKGTGTTAELVESEGMAIAVSTDWQTKKETTRPIVASVARAYYGDHFEAIPVAIVHPDGLVREINFKKKSGVMTADKKPPRRKKPGGNPHP